MSTLYLDVWISLFLKGLMRSLLKLYILKTSKCLVSCSAPFSESLLFCSLVSTIELVCNFMMVMRITYPLIVRFMIQIARLRLRLPIFLKEKALYKKLLVRCPYLSGEASPSWSATPPRSHPRARDAPFINSFIIKYLYYNIAVK